jgi:small subunit ribosomal protein S9
MAKTTEEHWATGRRKSATARVRIKPGKGKIEVNHRPVEAYFQEDAMRGYIMQPLVLTGMSEQFDISANIKGGGVVGQAGALRHGIARALQTANAELRMILKESGMLTRDARVKERKKYGQPGARKKFQFSKR